MASKRDCVQENSADYNSQARAHRAARRDPGTGRFVSDEQRSSRKMTLDQSIAHTVKRYSKTLKKLAE